jgi:hypothetical protein
LTSKTAKLLYPSCPDTGRPPRPFCFVSAAWISLSANADYRPVSCSLVARNAEFVEEGITGTGVLDVFDRYNFTVDEAEPLEKEVAVDPEMLGKVFENLIEENRRKQEG